MICKSKNVLPVLGLSFSLHSNFIANRFCFTNANPTSIGKMENDLSYTFFSMLLCIIPMLEVYYIKNHGPINNHCLEVSKELLLFN